MSIIYLGNTEISLNPNRVVHHFGPVGLRPTPEIDDLVRRVDDGLNPRDAKFELAVEIVDRFHGPGAGEQEKRAFIQRFAKGVLPEDLPETSVTCPDGRLGIASVMKEAGLVPSTSEAFRMLKQGAVKLDGERVEDRDLELEAGGEHILQVGKRRVARVRLN